MCAALKIGMTVLMLMAAPVVAQAGTLEGVAIGAGAGAWSLDRRVRSLAE